MLSKGFYLLYFQSETENLLKPYWKHSQKTSPKTEEKNPTLTEKPSQESVSFPKLVSVLHMGTF